jgi:hypothetical protein
MAGLTAANLDYSLSADLGGQLTTAVTGSGTQFTVTVGGYTVVPPSPSGVVTLRLGSGALAKDLKGLLLDLSGAGGNPSASVTVGESESHWLC